MQSWFLPKSYHCNLLPVMFIIIIFFNYVHGALWFYLDFTEKAIVWWQDWFRLCLRFYLKVIFVKKRTFYFSIHWSLVAEVLIMFRVDSKDVKTLTTNNRVVNVVVMLQSVMRTLDVQRSVIATASYGIPQFYFMVATVHIHSRTVRF